MFKYILKRLIIFIPTLIAVSLVAFALSKLAPGDPVELILKGGLNTGNTGQAADMLSTEKTYQETAERLGLHLPAFYFGFTTSAFPDTLHNVVKKDNRENLSKLISQYGNWAQISKYYQQLHNFQFKLLNVPQDSANYSAHRTARSNVQDLYHTYRDRDIKPMLSELANAFATDSSLMVLQSDFQELNSSYNTIISQATPLKNHIPAFRWYGFNNQYHRWISNFMKGDFGLSYLDNRPVSNKMWDALRWTLIINFISIILAYLLSIPIGVSTAIKKGTTYDKVSTTILFILYSLPVFWIGTLLIVFFTTPEYGRFLDLFPTGGVTDLPKSAPFAQRMLDISYHLILPVFCVTYGSLAFISRQMRGGMLSVIRQDYIRTAKAKGLNEKTIIWKHAFRNSLFPIITLFAAVFPAAIGGSVVIEVIYSIPGMGKLAYEAIIARDYPVVFTVLMLASILTMVGNLVADMLYAVADPRVSFDK